MTDRWTRVLFRISKINNSALITYNIVDLNNEPIESTFYTAELQKIDKSVLNEPFKLKKLLNRRKANP